MGFRPHDAVFLRVLDDMQHREELGHVVPGLPGQSHFPVIPVPRPVDLAEHPVLSTVVRRHGEKPVVEHGVQVSQVGEGGRGGLNGIEAVVYPAGPLESVPFSRIENELPHARRGRPRKRPGFETAFDDGQPLKLRWHPPGGQFFADHGGVAPGPLVRGLEYVQASVFEQKIDLLPDAAVEYSGDRTPGLRRRHGAWPGYGPPAVRAS